MKIAEEEMSDLFDQQKLLTFLQNNSISYDYYSHPAVYTSEEAEYYSGNLGGFHAKNLFLTNEKGRNFYLLVCAHDYRTDLKALGTLLGEKRMRFASPEKMQLYLGITPGAVTPLAVINDTGNEVNVLFEPDAWHADRILCHPLVNTASLMISHTDLLRFMELTGHAVKVLP